ncbi:hypothetical protein Sjap_023949 [Stephania japonica]|uniref:Uncharacterized protein n=1 Tax=Stephania japonica TaxID=461633 RepID=A0AAP0EFR5_9MAGN
MRTGRSPSEGVLSAGKSIVAKITKMPRERVQSALPLSRSGGVRHINEGEQRARARDPT